MRQPRQPSTWTNDVPSADEAVAKFRLQQRDVPLFNLLAKGYLTWDRDEGVVRKGPQFDERPRKTES